MNCSQFRTAVEAQRLGVPGAAVCDQFRAHARECGSCARAFAPFLTTTCEQITDFLAEYFEGGLPVDQREVFDFHMNACPECRYYLASYRTSTQLARECGAAAPPPPPQRLIDAILAARRAQSK